MLHQKNVSANVKNKLSRKAIVNAILWLSLQGCKGIKTQGFTTLRLCDSATLSL